MCITGYNILTHSLTYLEPLEHIGVRSFLLHNNTITFIYLFIIWIVDIGTQKLEKEKDSLCMLWCTELIETHGSAAYAIMKIQPRAELTFTHNQNKLDTICRECKYKQNKPINVYVDRIVHLSDRRSGKCDSMWKKTRKQTSDTAVCLPVFLIVVF